MRSVGDEPRLRCQSTAYQNLQNDMKVSVSSVHLPMWKRQTLPSYVRGRIVCAQVLVFVRGMIITFTKSVYGSITGGVPVVA